MGRTIMPYSGQIDRVRERFRLFKRALRREDQEIFSTLMRYARFHVQSGVMASFPNPSDPVFISIFIEMQKQIERQGEQIRALEQQLACRQNDS